MKNKIVAIGLFHDRIDLLVCQGGRVVASRRLPVSFETTAEAWALSLRKAGPALSDAVKDLKLAGWSAAVLYSSPTATSDYVSVKAGGAAEARQAAVLAISDSLGYPLALAVTGATVIARDAGTSEGQTHLVVAAERDDHAEALCDLVQSAGLKLNSATPIDGAVMAKVAATALAAGTQRSAHLYVGEQRSFFVIVDNGALVFARPVGLGVHAMATALTRPMRSTQAGEAIELDPASARTMLHAHGFPDRKSVVHDGLGLTGAQIIPLLQPVLQRFVVELRQSLRFGLAEEHRGSVTITITGPGSAIPGFAGIVGGELRMNVAVDKTYASGDAGTTDANGSELADAIDNLAVLSKLNLQPREMARQRQSNRMLRWMWTGAAAAMMLVGLEAMQSRAHLRAVQTEADSIAARSAEQQSMQASTAKMLAGIEAMTSLENTIASHLGAQVDYRACMQEIASLVPGSVRLTGIRLNQNDGKTTGSVLGYAFPDDGGAKKSGLETFISHLRESPLFEQVALGNVQVASAQSRTAQQFEVTVVNVAAPRGMTDAALSKAGDASSSSSTPDQAQVQVPTQGGQQP